MSVGAAAPRLIENASARRKPLLARLSLAEKALWLIFLATLPLVNPWVRGDGVGYYAFARALLIEHSLNFEKDWLAANDSFRAGRVDSSGQVAADQYTATGHLNNHFSVGPAILWSPFLVLAHLAVLSADRLGAGIPADGFSRPYRMAAALATALYGFLAVWLSFAMARKYFSELWAFVAALGIWFGSSLPVYMYFDPFWSHALSAFTVALFVWYWERTRGQRSSSQWILLGAMAGLMMDVYYPAVALLLFPAVESFWTLKTAAEAGRFGVELQSRLALGSAFGVAVLAAFLPTLIAKRIIYGGYFSFGYTERWFWWSPALLKVCFSSNHGLFTWTPLLLVSVVGLVWLSAKERLLGAPLLVSFAAYLYLMGCYEDWHGISSYGNRFFVSLTPLFVVGLAAALYALAGSLAGAGRWALVVGPAIVALAVLWNIGFIYQWGTQMVPARGPVDWRAMAWNQVEVVPASMTRQLELYLFHRNAMMRQIEQRDLQRLQH